MRRREGERAEVGKNKVKKKGGEVRSEELEKKRRNKRDEGAEKDLLYASPLHPEEQIRKKKVFSACLWDDRIGREGLLSFFSSLCLAVPLSLSLSLFYLICTTDRQPGTLAGDS